MGYKIEYKVKNFDRESECRSKLEIKYDFYYEIYSRADSKEEQNRREDLIKKRIAIGEEIYHPKPGSLDDYLLYKEELEKKEYNSRVTEYTDTNPAKKRSVRIFPNFVETGITIIVTSPKPLEPKELFDYEALNSRILSGINGHK